MVTVETQAGKPNHTNGFGNITAPDMPKQATWPRPILTRLRNDTCLGGTAKSPDKGMEYGEIGKTEKNNTIKYMRER